MDSCSTVEVQFGTRGVSPAWFLDAKAGKRKSLKDLSFPSVTHLAQDELNIPSPPFTPWGSGDPEEALGKGLAPGFAAVSAGGTANLSTSPCPACNLESGFASQVSEARAAHQNRPQPVGAAWLEQNSSILANVWERSVIIIGLVFLNLFLFSQH